jgi:membrane fusion protein, multidrug efflux system
MKNKKSIVLITAIILVSGGATALLIGHSAKVETPEDEKEARLVETDVLRYTPYTLEIEGHGFIQSSRSLEIIAQTSGKVMEAYQDLKSGVAVSKGELLVLLDDELAINDLALARVQLIQATASLLSAIKSEQSGTIYQRWSRYLNALNTESSRIPDLPKVESEREKLLTSTYGVLSAYYGVREQESLLSYHRITAPFDGHLDGDGAALHSFVSAGTPLLTLTDTVHLEISVPLTREEVLMLTDLDKIVTIYPSGSRDFSLSGRLVRQDALMNQNSQTIMVHIRFDNPEGHPLFMPGNYANILISGKTIPQAYALSRALINEDQTVNVYKEGRLELLPVEIAARQKDTVIIAPTLPEGTEIIMTRLQKPFPGMALKKAGEPELPEEGNAANEENRELSHE